MDDWKEPSDYANIHVSGGKKKVEEQELEKLEDKRKRDKKKRDAITPHLKKAGLYRDTRTGKLMHQVKDRLIEPVNNSLTLSGNDDWEPSAAVAEGLLIGNPTELRKNHCYLRRFLSIDNATI